MGGILVTINVYTPGNRASMEAPQVQVAAVKTKVNKEPRQRRFTQMPHFRLFYVVFWVGKRP